MSNIQKVKRSNGYAYRVLIRRNNRPSISKTFPTKTLAQQFSIRKESELQVEASLGRRKTSNITLSRLIKAYLECHTNTTRPKEQLRKLQFWSNTLGETLIHEMSSQDITNTLRRLPSKFSNATRNRYKASISVVLTFAITNYGLNSNPAKSVPFKPENGARIKHTIHF